VGIQRLPQRSTAWTPAPRRSHHSPVRVLAHIKKLDDCFGDFLVRVTCKCGAVREITPEALARLVGWSAILDGRGRGTHRSPYGSDPVFLRARAVLHLSSVESRRASRAYYEEVPSDPESTTRWL
jgi:hypothetical protein